jgi:putative protease
MMLRRFTDLRFRVEAETAEQLAEALSNRQLEYVYAPVGLLNERVTNKERVIAVQSVVNPEPLGGIREMGFNRVLVHTINHFSASGENMLLHGGFRLNITNSAAMKQYEKLGLADSILSIELSLRQAEAITCTIPRGVVVYGKLPMMLLKRDVNSDTLTDRKGMELPLVRRGSEFELLNPVPLVLSDRISRFGGFDFVVLKLTAGDSFSEVWEMYASQTNPLQNFTRGLY